MTEQRWQLDERMVALETAAMRTTLSSASSDSPRCALVLQRDRLEVRVDRPNQASRSWSPPRRTVQGVGAVVLGARVALAAQGWAVEVDRLPRPDDRELLAVVRPVEGGPEAGLAQLAAVAGPGPLRPRSARSRPPSSTLLERLSRAAAAEDSVLVPVVSDPDRRLIEELDGEARATLGPDPDDSTPGSRSGTAGPAPFLLLATAEDDELAWLRSGEALERVLLVPASRGQAASVLPEVLDVPRARARARSALCGNGHPQALLRLG